MFDFQPRSFFEATQPAVLKELDRLEQALLLFRGAEVITPAAGEVYSFGETLLEVLYTASDLPPLETATIRQYTNDGSLVFRLKAEGQTVLFLGDVQEAGDDVMIKRYGKALKADVCQVAHHGARASTCEFYDLVDPEILLWPSRVSRFEMFLGAIRPSYHLIKDLHVKDVILSGHGTRRMELPIRVSAQPFLPELIPDQRDPAPDLFLQKASREPVVSDPQDPVWAESEIYPLHPLLKENVPSLCQVRLLWTENALWWKAESCAERFPTPPEKIGTVDSNNLRLFFTEFCIFDIFRLWKDCTEEGIIENIKFYAEDKNLPHGVSRCSRPELCEYHVESSEEHFTVCGKLPFVRSHKKGDRMGLNFEFTLMSQDQIHRRVREMLQVGGRALHCGASPSNLCFVELC